jgi:hypothetical protein
MLDRRFDQFWCRWLFGYARHFERQLTAEVGSGSLGGCTAK